MAPPTRCRILTVALCAALGVTAWRAVHWSYDEGVYYYQACLWARGARPYTDFFVPQPPGVIALGAAAERLGLGIGGVRAVTFGCALGILYQTAALCRRVAERAGLGDPTGAGRVAALFVAATMEFGHTAVEAATFAPAGLLTVTAARLVVGEWRWRYWAAGAVLGLATGVRVQAATLGPALAAAVVCLDGWAAGAAGVVRMGVGFAVAAAAVHAGPAVAVPGYWNGVFGFHLVRQRVGLDHRVWTLTGFAGQPQVLFGCLAAVVQCAAARGAVRALGWAAVLGMAITTLTGNSLFRPYYLLVFPLAAAAGALAVAAVRDRIGRPAGVWAVTAVATCYSGIGVTSGIAAANRGVAVDRVFVAEIRATPADVWLTTDAKVVDAAGKRVSADYYATDPAGLELLGNARFQEWVLARLAEADAVAATELLGMLVTPDTARRILDSGKPVVYEHPEARRRLYDLAGRPEPLADER
jgi:hypothetical protein